MLRLLVSLFLCCFANLCAEPLERAKVKQSIGEVTQLKGKIRTGSSSRIELELPYLAVVRIGSNANFSFSSDAKKMTLERGTMLMAVPEKTEGISIESGSIIASVVKGDFEMSNVGGQVKLITLNGKVVAAMAANTSDRRSLRSGDMIDVPAGATQMPSATAIKLSALLKDSILFNMGPLPTSRAIRQNATKQAPPRPFVTGGFDPDWGGGVVNATTLGPAATAAMIARMEINASSRLPPLAPNQIPTQNQIVTFEAAGVPIPKSNIRAIQRSDVVRIIEGRRVEKPQPPIVVQPQPQPTPQPTRPPVVVQPTPRPTRPPVITPPIATPRPTIRPPIALP